MSAEWQFLITLNEQLRPLRDPVQAQEITLRLLGEHLGDCRINFAVIDGDEFAIVRSFSGDVPPFLTRGPLAMFGTAIPEACRRGDTVRVNDIATDPRLTDADRVAIGGANASAFVGAPLIKDGRWVAVLGVQSLKPRAWTNDQIDLIQIAAERMWWKVERERTLEALGRSEAERRANEERLAFLLRLNDALQRLSEAAVVQQTTVTMLGEHLGVARVAYAEYEGAFYRVRHEHARGVNPLVGSSPRPPVSGEIRDALRRGETVAVTDVDTDPRLTAEDRAGFHAREVRAFVTLHLFKDGESVAGFGATHNAPRVWTQAEIDLVRDVALRTWDAVQRTRAESEVRERDKRLNLALEASAGGSWSWVMDTNQVDWDERFRALYGFTADEPATADAWLPRVHEEDRPRMLAAMQEMMTSTTGTSWENTFRIVRPDGTVAWVQSRGRADRDPDGRILRLTGLDLDFDRHRRLEEAARAERDAEHDRSLHTLLETATQGIVSIDTAGVIVTANQAFETMFGWAPGALVGQTISRSIPQASLDRRAPQSGRELVGVRKDGATFPIEVTINHVSAPTGDRAFVFVTDITERQRDAAALRARTMELEYRTTQLSQMASDLTLAERHAREEIAKTLHDGLQQLLVIASSNLDRQLKRDGERGAGRSEPLVIARRHLDEAIAAARSLSIDLFPPVLQRAGLPAALEWLAGWAKDTYKLDVHVEADARADSARKDVRTLLFESVRELLFNAVKHAQADRVTLSLTLDADDRLCITVADRGVGFDLSTLDDRSKAGAAGWGLFSIRERLTLLGGRFDLTSAPGRGTQVRLVAPRGPAPAAPHGVTGDASTAAVVAVPPRVDATGAALRILLVDDHETIRSALREMIHERPQLAVVGEASNGFEAIASAHTLRPDVILMDVSMPHMDGVEATKRIHAELPDIEIFGLSMHSRSEVGLAIEKAGAAGFFVKGSDSEHLMDHLLAVHARRAGRPVGS